MDNLANFFQLLTNDTRVRIILLLKQRELCVCQLVGSLGMSQPRVSRQLAVLKRSELVISERTGKWNYYKINPDLDNCAKGALDSLPSWVDGDKMVESDRVALHACLERQESTGSCEIDSFRGIRRQSTNRKEVQNGK